MVKKMAAPLAAVIAISLLALSGALSAPAEEHIAITCGGKELMVEIAANKASRNTGLMGRQRLDKGRGMLFVYPSLRVGRLWMHKTLIPLSAAFIDEEGVITGIVRMEKTGSTRIHRSGKKIQYALEVPLGWFEENGVEAGDRCDIPDIPAE